MDVYRFYVPGLASGVRAREDTLDLPEDQGHHARSVLRLETGERVVVFDGHGNWAEGTILHGGKSRGMGVELTGGIQRDTPPAVKLTIAAAVPKGERAEWLVEQASQLYVWTIQWLASDRGVVKPREGGGKIEKWRRLAIESAKQCGRNHVMNVEEPVTLEEILRQAGGKKVLWLDPRGGRGVGEVMKDCAGEVVALVGPEGGWSEREAALLDRIVKESAGNLERVSLTPTILRIETACAAIAAIIMSGPYPTTT